MSVSLETEIPGTGSIPTALRPPRDQTSVPEEHLLNSANAGFLIHRVGQLKNEFRDEGLEFSSELVELINSKQAGYISIFHFEELFGTHNRLHWLLHLKRPDDYARMLDMVDHNDTWRDVSQRNRLPRKGGGNWERMFVEGSMSETIICPQHGLSAHDDTDHDEDHEHAGDTFQPAALHQTTLPPERLLNSVNSALTVHRTFRVPYALREEARVFAFEWCGYVNQALEGRMTAFLYEEMWGRQDTLHLLLHATSLDSYHRLLDMERNDRGLRALRDSQRLPEAAGGAVWHSTLIEGSQRDTLWVPVHRSAKAEGTAP
ncbi:MULTISPECIES: DUF6039 family protein [unclassified Streptomyces]|uniref:DUF6039 family protein n=1 Tax=unclassified Streptomyces TaxID=2593676 RepID=UPI002E2C62FA|nr:DUF6039 family protein [Streptomyces sp. NBC_00441]